MEFLSIAQQLKAGRPVSLRTVLEGPQAGSTCLLDAAVPSGIVTVDGLRCYEETYVLPPELFILGAGHVGRAAARLAAFIGLRVTVLDPRPELLQPELFPAGVETGLCSFDALEDSLPHRPVCYLVASASHTYDYLCARTLLKRPSLYLGMVGSRKKAAMIREKLLADGFTDAEADFIHSPVGLAIDAETPQEIAVSILAELIPILHRSAPGVQPAELLQALGAPESHGVLVTVIGKQGSSPRGAGAKMLVLADGTVLGTVGGGIVEFQAIQAAGAMTGFTLKTYASGRGEITAPVCGGISELMFQPFDNRS